MINIKMSIVIEVTTHVAEEQKPFAECISAEKLKQIGGVKNLFDLLELTIKIDASETSIGNIGTSLGQMAPNLRKLNLSNSFITSVRDLGTCFTTISTLWLSRCCLEELDGISSISTLKELFLAFNEISDLSALSLLENLEVLDLEENNVDDIRQFDFLAMCINLKALTAKGNPVELAPTPTTSAKDLRFYSYREAIFSYLPQLVILDDVKFKKEIVDGKILRHEIPQHNITNISDESFKEDLKIIADSLKTIEVPDEEVLNTVSSESSFSRPFSACLRNHSAKVRPTNSITTISPTIFPRRQLESSSAESSELTCGKVICGNPVQVLQRKNRTTQSIAMNSVANFQSKPHFIPEHSYLSPEEESREVGDVIEQLKLWRQQNVKLSAYNPSPPSTAKPTFARLHTSLKKENIAVQRSSTALNFSLFDSDREITGEEIGSSLSSTCQSDVVYPVRPSTARAALRSSTKVTLG